MLLLVEDDDPKRDRIKKFLLRTMREIEIREARSVRSALRQIREHPPEILILDMSLPTFDISEIESGGRPQGFGGKEILKYLQRYDITCPAIVVTSYEAFLIDAQNYLRLEDMDRDLEDTFPTNYFGLVYYNSLYGDWEEKLTAKLKGLNLR